MKINLSCWQVFKHFYERFNAQLFLVCKFSNDYGFVSLTVLHNEGVAHTPKLNKITPSI